ncbi:MAG: zinc-dependent peptidase [Pseudomonadales bacterium]|nr:zinc-dependent peptidase [Pseudomonadales bacterium]
MKLLLQKLQRLLGFSAKTETKPWQDQWSTFLMQTVAFYRVLSAEDKIVFEQRIQLFLQTTAIEGGVDVAVSDNDRLLVAASAVIPVWGFPGWHYFNLATVHLLPGAFNEDFKCGKPDSCITGMVGSGPMAGKMALSQPDLHLGFKNSRDKHNVGIHEFVHLVDMADGSCDGFPERLKDFSYAIPWLEFVGKKIIDIDNNKSNIRDYGATNEAEFFAVASEYFFERPKMLQRKHPKLFAALEDIFQQDVLAIADDIKVGRQDPCPCGSGKKYKRCCLPTD